MFSPSTSRTRAHEELDPSALEAACGGSDDALWGNYDLDAGNYAGTQLPDLLMFGDGQLNEEMDTGFASSAGNWISGFMPQPQLRIDDFPTGGIRG